MLMPTFPLAQLGQFRSELHACFPGRADALFELGDALPGDQEASHQAQEEAKQDHQSYLSGSPSAPSAATSADGQLGTPAGLNHKLRGYSGTSGEAMGRVSWVVR